MGIKDSNFKYTPSDSILHADPSHTPREDIWNYRSVIGKLNFLAQKTRPRYQFRGIPMCYYDEIISRRTIARSINWRIVAVDTVM